MSVNNRESEERRETRSAVAIYSGTIMACVLTVLFAVINLFRGRPIWDICTIFFAFAATYDFVIYAQKRNDSLKTRLLIKLVAAIVSFILYIVF